jgi:DNA-binding MarR family transcriptional regulator
MNIDLKTARRHGLSSIAQIEAVCLLADGPETMTAIAAYTDRTTAATTQLGDKLERLGLAERIRGSKDRRAIWIRLTEKGLAAAAEIRATQAITA